MFGFRRWLTRPLRYAIYRLIEENNMNQVDAIIALKTATATLTDAATRISAVIATGGATSPEFDTALSNLQGQVAAVAAIVPAAPAPT